MIRVGGVLFGVGVVCALIALLPLVVPTVVLPGVWWFLAMLMGAGFLLIVLGLLIEARRRGQLVRAQLPELPEA